MKAGTGKNTIANFISVAILQMGNYVLPMVTLPIISRIIGPEKYGAINYAFAFVGYFILFINAGFDLYGARQIVQYKEDTRKVQQLFSRITFAKLYMLLVCTLAFIVCLFTIEHLKNEKLISIFTYLLCLGWVINPSWLYNGLQQARRYSVFSFISKLLFSIAVILVVQHRSDYIYHPLITSVAHILVSVISFYYAMKKYKIHLEFVKFKEVIQTLKENKTLSIVWWLSNQASSTNILVAGFFLFSTEIGLYAAAVRIIIIILSITSMPLNTVLFPYIGQAFADNHKQGLERVNRIFPYLVLIALTMTVGTIVVSKYLILCFFGNEFNEAIPLLNLLAPVLFFSTINSALGQQVLLQMKKDNAYLKFIFSGFIGNIFLLVICIHFYGTAGAALAWTISEIGIFISYLIYLKYKHIKVVNPHYFKPGFVMAGSRQMVQDFLNKRKQKAA